jgi:hypothetical protein
LILFIFCFSKDSKIKFDIEKIYNENITIKSNPIAFVITYKQYKASISVFKDLNEFLYIGASSNNKSLKWFSDVPRAMQKYIYSTILSKKLKISTI